MSDLDRHIARRNKLLLIASVFVIIVGSSAALLVAAAFAPEKDNVQIVPDMGNQHVSVDVGSAAYNTHPPTSGPHRPELVAWGEHSAPIPDMRQLHNLEAGGVIIHYDCDDGCPQIVADLRDVIRAAGPDLIILEPYPDMDHRIAVTAWGRLLEMDTVDRQEILDFIHDYRGLDHG